MLKICFEQLPFIFILSSMMEYTNPFWARKRRRLILANKRRLRKDRTIPTRSVDEVFAYNSKSCLTPAQFSQVPMKFSSAYDQPSSSRATTAAIAITTPTLSVYHRLLAGPWATRQPTTEANLNTTKENRAKRKRIMQSKRGTTESTSSGNEAANRYNNGFAGISKDYLDIGDPIDTCRACGAILWHDEAVRGYRKEHSHKYALCCMHGKVQLPRLKDAPKLLLELYQNKDARSNHFLQNIRRYNMMFSFTSMGGKVDSKINSGRGPYVFRIHGQNYHTLGSLFPQVGSEPKFSQLYIYDTDNEVPNRIRAISCNADSPRTTNSIDNRLAFDLKSMLDTSNELVKSYRMVRDRYHCNGLENVKLRLIGTRTTDGRTYNLPTSSEVAVLIVGDIDNALDPRDILIKTQTGRLQRINELHPSYLPLQFPLLFPYGDDGYRTDIPHRDVTDIHTNTRKQIRLTMREFFAYRIQDRTDQYSLVLNSRRLFQQFLVDGYTMIESERLYYVRKQQINLRCSSYESLTRSLDNGNTDGCQTGRRVILPSSFTGGARYMMQNYLDAMSLCKWFGYPDLFITLTCNPKWPKITRYLTARGLKPEDRPDITCRVFKIKLDSFIKDMKKKKLFGRIRAVVYTIEFQKRGLPHSHICIFMHPEDKLQAAEDIDRIISAEIPDKNSDPQLFTLVKEFMIHGPCGLANPKCPCMNAGKCTKKFPRKFSSHSSVDADGYPLYMRRDSGNFVEKNGVRLDNRYVVPYNRELLKKYEAHINVEWCNQAGSIKYLFKYINKGPDRVTAAVCCTDNEHTPQNEELDVDEIKDYYDCRYISACEATWRIYGFDIHYRIPSVERLSFHLPGEQQVIYDGEDDLNNVLTKPSVGCSMFLSWMDRNKTDVEARELTYVEFPTKFVWKSAKRIWAKRKKGFSVGRIHHVPPSAGEGYFLRILLNKVKGPGSFEDIRTVNGRIYPTFKEACYARGLLADDKEYIEAIQEASQWGTGHYLRFLFVMLLTSHSLSRPAFLWEKTWKLLSDDIVHEQRVRHNTPGYMPAEDDIQNRTLLEIEKIMRRNGSSLNRFPELPYPDEHNVSFNKNSLIEDELSYDTSALKTEHAALFSSLTPEQRQVYQNIMNVVQAENGGVFFIYGYGGTGKTFIWKTLSAAIRSKGDIVLSVASSGIASLLLTGGRTAHSRFAIPINVTEDSVCSIQPDSELSALLKRTRLIIWDEVPMVHKHCFEALDRTLTDILCGPMSGVGQRPFGGKVVVFGGDFRQILPVIPKGNRHDIVNAALNSSYLWKHCRVMRLTVNMRLQVGCVDAHAQQTKEFAEWILNIGDGECGDPNDGEATVEIPKDMLIHNSNNPVQSMIDFVYPSVQQNLHNSAYFQERAILAPTHEVVDVINTQLLALIPGEEKTYLSSDNLCETEPNTNITEALYSPDMLNTIRVAGIPNHKLTLKVGVPVMLLRNLDQPGGLCNGTRLRVVSLGNRVIEAKIISGGNIGTRTFIPRVKLSPSDKNMPFRFNRRQFPLAVCFAMTINKSQGQSLSKVGLCLTKPVFTHGQLYVALSRVKSRNGLKVLICDKDGKVTNRTTNVVYKEVLQRL